VAVNVPMAGRELSGQPSMTSNPSVSRRQGGALDWERDGGDWPLREHSRFVKAGPISWHVQILGAGPPMLLLHGTGAATHSWRGLAPLLAKEFTLIAPDLPGHGFTSRPGSGRLSLPGMAKSIGELLEALEVTPQICVGHSAGAAVLIEMALDDVLEPARIVSLNGALLPFRGVAGRVFSPLAKLLVMNPVVPRVFAWQAGSRGAVERLLTTTGSEIDALGTALYARLIRNPAHVSATLAMMARWDLETLERRLSRLSVPLTLIVGEGDKTVSPADARHVQRLVPDATLMSLPKLGHLAHEEAPEQLAAMICDIAKSSLP